MIRRCYFLSAIFLLAGTALMLAAVSETKPDLDPEALAILKETVGSITAAQSFSFHVLVSRDRQATNNQLVTYFNVDQVTVSRPNKLRIDVDGEHNDVQFFFNGTAATLFDPEKKLYISKPAPGTIDDMLKALEKLGVSFPISDLLQSNPYDSLANGLQSAYIIGHVNIANKAFIHLVFTEAAADWQLWVEQGDKPVPRAIVIIYKSESGAPRVTMDFTEWNLNAQPQAQMFDFVKPDDAHEVQFFPSKAGK